MHAINSSHCNTCMPLSAVTATHACRYYVSAWCRNQTPGGLLVDMSVHHMAALRLVAEAAGAGKALSVKASTRDSGTGLAGPDCADATVTWHSGLVSCLSICMVAGQVCESRSARIKISCCDFIRMQCKHFDLVLILFVVFASTVVCSMVQGPILSKNTARENRSKRGYS
jgi:hypothetical protein